MSVGKNIGSLEGHVAIVTGAAQGQGLGIAREMAARGARVLVTDIEDELGRAAAESIGANARFCHLNTADRKDWEAAVRMAEETFGGPVSVLSSSAGVFSTEPVEELTEEQYLRVIRINQIGPLLGMQAVLPGMKRRGGGSIVNTSSLGNTYPVEGSSAYCASKAALTVMTRVAAKELAKYNIRVNSIAPGAIDNTNMFSGVPEEARQAYLQRIPLGRFGLPEDIAKLVCFLASDEAAWITGSEFAIDGGMTSTQ